MAASIGDVVTDPGLRAELVRKGHQRAGTYSWRRTAELTRAVLLDVLAEP